MEENAIELGDSNFAEFNTIIIGTGAAGLNCAIHLVEEGVEASKIAIVTEKLGGGTSFNTGSDKQTYYKMSLIGDQVDSPHEMAKDLFKGGAMHGDIALIEATNSIREFFHLVQLGVPFPHDEYGGFVGYKTDNDPKQRATSIGPLTSQQMGIKLLDEVRNKKIKIFNNCYAVKILVDDTKNEVIGLICLKIDDLSSDLDYKNFIDSFMFFLARNVVIATGGPAKLYKNSVYPISQSGTTSLAIEAGCKLQNLTESQFGLASIDFRWNVSGSYQQVIPRYISIDEDNNEFEFLNDHFPSFKALSKAVFLKGYQWPFNSERIENYGSSLIDLAVFYETEILKRRVYLDYTRNPTGYVFEELDDTVREYLEKSYSTGDNPIVRLNQMNPKAVQLYKDHDIDINQDPLRIAVCNQHLNGGITGDIWWETNVKHLFAIGEINGSHGVHRPGGAALNSGQIGGLRAAQRIAHNYNTNESIDKASFNLIIMAEFVNFASDFNNLSDSSEREKLEWTEILYQIQDRMSKFGSFIRPLKGLVEELIEVHDQLIYLSEIISIKSNIEMLNYYMIKDKLITQLVFLTSILEYHNRNGGSRGSYVTIKEELNEKTSDRYIIPPGKLGKFRFVVNDLDLSKEILTIRLDRIKRIKDNIYMFDIFWDEVRPIPEDFGWFETVWKKYSSDDVYR